MKQYFNFFPNITPWILFIFFVVLLFVDIEFRYALSDKQPLEILMESEQETINQDTWNVRKGPLLRLNDLKNMKDELEISTIPQDGIPESTIERLTRIIFGQKVLIWLLVFLLVLCLSSFVSWFANTWFSITLNKTLHWIGLIFTFFHLMKSLAFVTVSPLAIFLAVYFSIQFAFLILSYKAINRQKKNKLTYEILKHTSELDEEGKKPTQKIELRPFRMAYHFAIIIIVGLLLGNFLYIPLFLLQKHYTNEFSILLLVMVFLLCVFYIRNYYNLSKENIEAKWQGVLTSISYLQYKFLKNLALGIGATLLLILFVTVLFMILVLNADALKNPSLGIIEKSAEF
jgi:F0F1-type ATP synthase assembly protein I